MDSEIIIMKTAKRRSPADYAALAIAACGGVGYAPLVPATFGSAFGIGVYLLAQAAGEIFALQIFDGRISPAARVMLTLALAGILFSIGIWSATRCEKLTGKKDPRIVVVDEVVGQLITFLLIPGKFGWGTLVAGFLAFRLFDIWKPYPANRLEDLPAGWGVMADDAMAGFYAAVSLWILCRLNPNIFN